LRNPRSGLLAGGIVVLVLAAQQLGIFGLANEVTVLQLPAAIAGMAGVVFLLQRFPKNALLTRIGYYSYTIYLWHVMAGAAMRGALMHAGVTSIPMLFLFSLTAGVVTPIIMYEAARRVPASQRRCAPCRQTASLWRNSECAAS
jgi:peptidoglycan/LPS O-acetylase OafA/YrhL